MTASPTDAGAGMPSEDYASRAYCLPSDLADIVKSALPSIAIAIEEWLFNGAADDRAAADIAALIRPAFDAKEREIEALKKLPVIADYIEVQDHARAMEARALSAEAKLAQAVEALEPFDDALGEDDDGYPDETKLTVSWRAHTYHALTLADLRRARSASARGEK